MTLYALQKPTGEIVPETIARTKQDCWGNSFEIVASEEGDEWRGKYWKRWDASRKAAERLGYSVAKVRIMVQP